MPRAKETFPCVILGTRAIGSTALAQRNNFILSTDNLTRDSFCFQTDVIDA